MFEPPPTTQAAGSELRETVRLALPLALATAGGQLLSVVDVFIAGRMGEQILAATALGQAVSVLITILPMGVLLGLDPLISQALGRGERARSHQYFASAARLTRLMLLPALLAMGGLMATTLQLVDFDAGTAEGSWGYLLGRAPSLWPFLLFVAQRSLLQAWGRTGPIAVAMVIGNVVNLPISALLAMGDEALLSVGLPAIGLGPGLGPTGIGLGTTVVALCQFGWLARSVRRLPDRPAVAPPKPPVGELWRMGWPIALQLGSEASIFAGTALVMGIFGETALAGHQIAFNLISLTFTICLGISAATTVRVGLATGAGSPRRARQAATAGLGVGMGVMLCTATIFVLFGAQLAAVFTDAPAVVEAAAGFLMIAALFQLLDGLQVIGTAGLRGAGRTREAMLIGVVGYWAIGFPTGLGLALGADLGPQGLWYGLVAGLAFSGPVAALRLFRATRSP